jgi:hypothetical protein
MASVQSIYDDYDTEKIKKVTSYLPIIKARLLRLKVSKWAMIVRKMNGLPEEETIGSVLCEMMKDLSGSTQKVRNIFIFTIIPLLSSLLRYSQDKEELTNVIHILTVLLCRASYESPDCEVIMNIIKENNILPMLVDCLSKVYDIPKWDKYPSRMASCMIVQLIDWSNDKASNYYKEECIRLGAVEKLTRGMCIEYDSDYGLCNKKYLLKILKRS